MKKNCSLCNGNIFTVVFSRMILDTYNVEIFKCQNCGFIYSDIAIDELELHKFISEKYYQTKKGAFQIDQRFVRHYTRRAYSHIKLFSKLFKINFDGCVLDVGCGAGLFLNEMKKGGWKTFGIEPSCECFDYATTVLNLDIYRGLFDEYQTNEKFDLVYFSHSFDDLPNIVRVLKKINNLLNDTGKIFIEVPNSNRDTNFNSVKDGDFIENRYYFTPSTLRHLVENNGFKIEYLVTYEPFYLNTAFQYLGSPASYLRKLFMPSSLRAHIRLIGTSL